MFKGGIIWLLFMLACLLQLATLFFFEDEYSILKCKGEHKTSNNSKLNITWYKIVSPNVRVNISEDIKRRIIMNRDLLEFWPLSSNDSGEYFCSVQGTNHRVKKLTVKKKNRAYCNDSSPESLKRKQGDSVTISDKLPHEYKNSNYLIEWYKDCKLYAKDVREISFNSVQLSNAAIYTYFIIRVHNGLPYNVSRKTRLIVEAFTVVQKENLKPKIKGVGSVTRTEVELGQNLSLLCQASVNDKTSELYWIKTNKTSTENLSDILDNCGAIITKACMVQHKKEEQTVTTELHVININEDDINYPYICKLDSIYGGDTMTFELKLKEKNPDISKSVFTTSIIASIICSISIVFLVILCILYRIQIVLLYRNVTGLDETIGDGKEYDAYLSVESYSSPEGEEKDFAFQTLAPILENCFGFKLCIFERDVVPGGALVDDMHSFLEKSRRLIIVLSKNYTSDKAMYELESGLHKAMVERKIKVILIEFTPLSELSVLPESLQLLKMRNRVKWKGNKSHPLNSTFWKTIQYLMPAKPVKSNSNFQRLKRMQAWTKDED